MTCASDNPIGLKTYGTSDRLSCGPRRRDAETTISPQGAALVPSLLCGDAFDGATDILALGVHMTRAAP